MANGPIARRGVSESGNATRSLPGTCASTGLPGPVAPGGRQYALEGFRMLRKGYFRPLSGCACFAFAIASATSLGM